MKRDGAPTGRVLLGRNPDVTWREMQGGEGALLLHRHSGAYHRLNRTGVMIWRAIEKPLQLDELELRLRAEITDAPPSFTQDLATYVGDLADRGLLQLEEPPPD